MWKLLEIFTFLLTFGKILKSSNISGFENERFSSLWETQSKVALPEYKTSAGLLVAYCHWKEKQINLNFTIWCKLQTVWGIRFKKAESFILWTIRSLILVRITSVLVFASVIVLEGDPQRVGAIRVQKRLFGRII